MLSKLSATFHRLKTSCFLWLMQNLVESQKRHGLASGDTLQALLPIVRQLLNDKDTAVPGLVAPALNALLNGQSQATSVMLARSLLLSQLPPEEWAMIPSLEKRDTPVMSTWTYQNAVMKWEIAPNDLVLDIGSGGWPFKRANHLADKYPDQTTHRMETMVRDQRPFFEVDLERLPFADHAYDFVFCSHVLEHLDNPGQALRELMRVGRRGYIEVPTRLSDVMFNFTRLQDHHRWHGMMLGKTLVLVEWNDSERHEMGNQFFDALHSQYANGFQDFFERNRDVFFASCAWEGGIEFLIIDKQGAIIDSLRTKA